LIDSPHEQAQRSLISSTSRDLPHTPYTPRDGRKTSSESTAVTKSSRRRRTSKVQLVPESEDQRFFAPTASRTERRYQKPIEYRPSKRLSSTSSHQAPSSNSKRSIAQPGSIEDTLGSFFPKLSRILEGREEEPSSNTARHRHRSTSTTSNEYEPAAPPNVVPLRRAARYKKNSLQHRFGVLSNPSLQSLFSTLTSNSSGSSGSNSTVTQRSYERHAISKRRKKSNTRNSFLMEGDRTSTRRRITSRTTRMQRRDSKHEMDEEEKCEGEVDTTPKRTSRLGSASNSDADDDTADEARSIGEQSPFPSSNTGNFAPDLWKRQETFNSDSGISVSSSPEVTPLPERLTKDVAANSDSASSSESNSSSSESESEEETETRPSPTGHPPPVNVSTGIQYPRALPDIDPHVMRLQNQEEEMRQHILHSPQPQRSLRNRAPAAFEPSSPLPLYDSRLPSVVPHGYPIPPPHAPNIPHGDPSMMYPPFQHSLHHHPPPDAPFGLDLKKTTIAGYELLASQLAKPNADDSTGGNMRPVYRKFEHLNHRVLLHLQDELSELEEELRILDESIAQMTQSTERNILQPASRRAEARFGSDLHFRRTEVLGRIFVKLGQYSTLVQLLRSPSRSTDTFADQALASYNTASSSFAPARNPDIAAYRAWMEENAPIERLETRFLNHEQDLMAVSKPRSSAPHDPPRLLNVRHASVVLSILALFPLLAITVVSSLFTRMFVVFLVGFAGIGMASSVGLASGVDRDFALCVSM
jgi:hypothetical protein